MASGNAIRRSSRAAVLVVAATGEAVLTGAVFALRRLRHLISRLINAMMGVGYAKRVSVPAVRESAVFWALASRGSVFAEKVLSPTRSRTTPVLSRRSGFVTSKKVVHVVLLFAARAEAVKMESAVVGKPKRRSILIDTFAP